MANAGWVGVNRSRKSMRTTHPMPEHVLTNPLAQSMSVAFVFNHHIRGRGDALLGFGTNLLVDQHGVVGGFDMGAVFVRVHKRELGAEEQNLRRIVNP